MAFTAQDVDPVTGEDVGVAQVFLRDQVSGKTQLISVQDDGSPARQASANGEVSRGGRFVAFSTAFPFDPADRNGAVDMYVRDVEAGTSERVSVASDGSEAPQGGFGTQLSWTGRYATFVTTARLTARDLDDTEDAYRFDRVTNRTELVSRGRGVVGMPDVEMSEDGRAVAIVPAPGDSSLVLVADLRRRITTEVEATAGSAG